MSSKHALYDFICEQLKDKKPLEVEVTCWNGGQHIESKLIFRKIPELTVHCRLKGTPDANYIGDCAAPAHILEMTISDGWYENIPADHALFEEARVAVRVFLKTEVDRIVNKLEQEHAELSLQVENMRKDIEENYGQL